jgi:hypothetical protein
LVVPEEDHEDRLQQAERKDGEDKPKGSDAKVDIETGVLKPVAKGKHAVLA